MNKSRFQAHRGGRTARASIGLLTVCCLLFGCGESRLVKSSRSAKTESGAKGKSAADAAADRCQTLFSGALAMMKPENLGVSSESTGVVSVLNNWAATCGAAHGAPPDPELTRLLSESEQKIAAAAMFDVNDVEHIRDCWLFQRAGRAAAESTKDDADRATKLFELACRTVGLAAPEQLLPQMPYGIVVTGRGSAEDRAWVFAELLRQIGLDTLVVRPKGEGAAKAGDQNWLIGVPIEGQVYLYDPLLGWPVPSAKDDGITTLVRKAATLAEVIADPKAFDRLVPTPESAYRMKSADFKQVAVAAISSRLYWSPRMRRLQGFLSGENSFTVATQVGDEGQRPGLLVRLGSAGGSLWKKEDVTIWDYPARRLEATKGLTPQQEELRKQMWLPFEGPLVVEVSPVDFSPKIAEKSRKLLRARIQHLMGELPRALMTYLTVQLEEMQPRMPLPSKVRETVSKEGGQLPDNATYEVPREAVIVNARAAELGKYWMGVCQVQQGEFLLAAETLDAYLAKYRRVRGTWINDAALLIGIAQAENKQYALAVASVNQQARETAQGDPRRVAFELYANRWRALREAEKSETKPPEKSAETPPATSAPSSPTTAPATPAAARPAAIAPVVAEPPISKAGGEPKKS